MTSDDGNLTHNAWRWRTRRERSDEGL